MSQALHAHLTKFIAIGDAEFADVLRYFERRDVKKKQDLLVAGDMCRHDHFVEQGCLRLFFVNDKGVERTTQFAIDNWWIADHHSLATQEPSEYHIQAVERSTVLSIERDAREAMLARHPIMERYLRLVYQRLHAAAQFRIRTLYGLSREELYHRFRTAHPEFVQRVPQYLLASFLGLTPEYLSEIRRKRS